MQHTVQIDRLFDGKITARFHHYIDNAVDLVRAVRRRAQGGGHEISLEVTQDCALDLGLTEAGGSLWVGATELCTGRVARDFKAR